MKISKINVHDVKGILQLRFSSSGIARISLDLKALVTSDFKSGMPSSVPSALKPSQSSPYSSDSIPGSRVQSFAEMRGIFTANAA